MMGSYLDLDAILMEEEPVPVVFRTAAAGVGILDPSSEQNLVAARSKVELPFWLAYELRNAEAVSVQLPSCFNQKIRKEMKADPGCVDLRSRCPYFYELGCRLVRMFGDKTLCSFLLFSLQWRYKEMLTKCHSAALSVVPRYLALLTREEMHIFESGSESTKAFRRWQREGTRLERAAVLGKKRRSVQE